MKSMYILFQKEMLDSIRSGKWIWLPIVIIILGISQPISTYYMPQILEMAGGLPAGTKIEFPVPSGAEVLASTLSQYGSTGTLLFVLATMGVISYERQSGALTLVMIRPVSAFQYILSKWFGQLSISLASLFLSYLLTWYYTNLLFSAVPWNDMLISFLVYSLWLVFVLSFTLWIGTALNSIGGIAGVSILGLALLSILTSVFTTYTKWSPSTIREHATSFLLNQQGLDTLFLSVTTTVLLSILFLLLAVWTFKRIERF